MFITAAYAQTAQAPGGGNLINQIMASPLVFMVAVLLIMYFLILRPQQKKMQEHRDLIAALKRGDVVVTAGGLIGKVTKIIGDAELQIELAEGVRVRAVRATIAEVRTRGDVREADARKALSRKDEVDDDEADASPPQPANDTSVPKKDS
jgi:preprotein translocase subunit YajC